MSSSMILMLTIHVYCPPSDVIRGVSESELVLDTMKPIVGSVVQISNHCIVALCREGLASYSEDK